MPKPTPKEVELKALIDSLIEYANEAVKVSATKSIGLNILNSFNYLALNDATEFLRRRENWLKTSYTNNLPEDMKVDLENHLKVAQLFVTAKDGLDSSFKCIESLRELKSSLEYVVKGHRRKGFYVILDENLNGTPVPEQFNNRWSDLVCIELGFKYLRKVLSNSDLKFIVSMSVANVDNLLNDLYELIRMSAIERYVIFEGKQAAEADIDTWRSIYKDLMASKVRVTSVSM